MTAADAPVRTAAVREAIDSLYGDYAALLDDDDYEAWLGLFAESCSYVVIPRDNHDRGLPVALMRCDNLDMLRDRITALTTANEYNIHWSLRILGRPRITAAADGLFDVGCSYLVMQTNQEGQSRVFSAGRHRDRVSLVDGLARFEQKKVIVDTFCIPTLLAKPL